MEPQKLLILVHQSTILCSYNFVQKVTDLLCGVDITHTYEDCLRTIQKVQNAGMAVCYGRIFGLGETISDRLRLLEVISNFDPQPESVPINCLMPMPGTPLAENSQNYTFDLVRMIAVTGIAIPKAKVRLSAGRTQLSDEAQALCFVAGAISIDDGDKLLTAKKPFVEKFC